MDEHLRSAGDFLTAKPLISGKVAHNRNLANKARLHIFRDVFGVPSWELRAHTQIALEDEFLVKPWVGCHLSFLGVYPSNLKYPSVE